jgi:Fic family protein
MSGSVFNGPRSRSDRSKEYDIHDAEAFELQPISKLRFQLDSETAATLNDAENAIWDLNSRPHKLPNATYAQALLNVEAMASVRMDGRPPSARDIFLELADAEVHGSEKPEYIVRYERDRASLVYTLGLTSRACTVDDIRNIHARSLPPRHEQKGGKLRDDLKQVGGSRYHTFGTVYKMPPPERIDELLEDLVAFMEQEEILVVEQAGIAHAQFINIHPFERGNGKMGRIVVHYELAYRGIAPNFLLPITPVIVTSSHDYVAGINACQLDGSEDPEVIGRNMNDWIWYFSTVCSKAANITSRFISSSDELIGSLEEKNKFRKGSAALQILEYLPALPAFSVQMAADKVGCSFKRASEACKQLQEMGILSLLADVKRNRVYYSPEMLEIYLDIDALR